MSARHTLAFLALMSALAPAGAVMAQSNTNNSPEPPAECTSSDTNCIRDPEVPTPSAGPESNSGLGTGTLPGSMEPGNTVPGSTGLGTSNGTSGTTTDSGSGVDGSTTTSGAGGTNN